MHFIGMLAFHLPVEVTYGLSLTFISLLIVIAVSAYAFYHVGRKKISRYNHLLGAVLMGLGISSMHYMGMAAMRMDAMARYRPGIFFLSIIIAITASYTALWLLLYFCKEEKGHENLFHLLSALVMGLAVVGMHYTGMYAAVFVKTTTSLPLQAAVNTHLLAFTITIAVAVILCLGLLSAFQLEVSQRKSVEAALRESETFLRTIQENAADGIIVIDDGGTIKSFNMAAEKMYGYSADEVLGRNVDILMSEPYHSSHNAYLERYIRTKEKRIIGVGRDVEALRKDGTVYPIRLAVSETFIGDCRSFTAILHDLTEQKKAEEDLRKLSRAVEQSPVTVMITDLNGDLTYVNPKFCEVSGYEAEEVIGENPRFLKSGHTSDEEYKTLWKTISSGNEWRGELHTRKKNGELFWESASISPIKSADGAITHYVAIKEDLTERKRLEEKLRELSFVDGLTGLANRRSYEKAIKNEWNRAKRTKTAISVIMIDIDYFKSYNDTLGHAAGDECLRSVALSLKSKTVRGGDMLARYGGEEFIVILPSSDKNTATRLAEILRAKVESLGIKHPASVISDYVTISLGVASTIPGEVSDSSTLVSAADGELYRAKEEGRNMVKGIEL